MYWVKLLYTVCVCMHMSRICTQYYSLHSKLYRLRGNAMVPLSRVAAGVMTFVVCYMSVFSRDFSKDTATTLCLFSDSCLLGFIMISSWSRPEGLLSPGFICCSILPVVAVSSCRIVEHLRWTLVRISVFICLTTAFLHPVLLSVSVGHWSESLCLSASQPSFFTPCYWASPLDTGSNLCVYLPHNRPSSTSVIQHVCWTLVRISVFICLTTALLHPVLLSVSVGHWSESLCLSASQPVLLHPSLLSVSVGHWFESLCLSASQPSFFAPCYWASPLDTGSNLCVYLPHNRSSFTPCYWASPLDTGPNLCVYLPHNRFSSPRAIERLRWTLVRISVFICLTTGPSSPRVIERLRWTLVWISVFICLTTVLLQPVLFSMSVGHWSESLCLSASPPVLLHPVLLSISVGHWSESLCFSASQPVLLHPSLLSVSVGHWSKSLCLSASQPSFFAQRYWASPLDTGSNLCVYLPHNRPSSPRVIEHLCWTLVRICVYLPHNRPSTSVIQLVCWTLVIISVLQWCAQQIDLFPYTASVCESNGTVANCLLLLFQFWSPYCTSMSNVKSSHFNEFSSTAISDHEKWTFTVGISAFRLSQTESYFHFRFWLPCLLTCSIAGDGQRQNK